MKINTVTVSAGRTVSHPIEDFANIRPELSMTATLEEGDDPVAVVRELQAQAERLVQDHLDRLVDTLVTIDRMDRQDRQIANLETELAERQKRLDALRAEAEAADTSPPLLDLSADPVSGVVP